MAGVYAGTITSCILGGVRGVQPERFRFRIFELPRDANIRIWGGLTWKTGLLQLVSSSKFLAGNFTPVGICNTFLHYYIRRNNDRYIWQYYMCIHTHGVLTWMLTNVGLFILFVVLRLHRQLNTVNKCLHLTVIKVAFNMPKRRLEGKILKSVSALHAAQSVAALCPAIHRNQSDNTNVSLPLASIRSSSTLTDCEWVGMDTENRLIDHHLLRWTI